MITESTIQGIAAIAFAAMGVAVGATDKELLPLWDHLQNEPLPLQPEEAVAQFRNALRELRKEQQV